MSNFLPILIVTALFTSSFTVGLPLSCKTSNGYEVCKDPSGVVSSVHQLNNTKIRPKLKINKITGIQPSAFKGLTALKNLTIGPHHPKNCQPRIIDITPESFYGLSSLEDLFVTCADLRGASSPFKDLDSLKQLRFIRNQFTKFPRELCTDVPGLKELVVTEQRIGSVSPESFSYITQGLETFALISSGLKVIKPYSFLRFHDLKSLLLMRNYLETIRPNMFDGLHNLTELNLSENRLREIQPATFSVLKLLRGIYLHANRLESLPNGIFKGLEHLEFLGLDGNPISIVSHNLFQGLNDLVELTMSFSEKIQIESDAFRGLKLTSLRLNADEVNVLEAETFRGLVTKSLFLLRNNTIDFKPNLFKGLLVERVYIWEKSMTRIDKKRWGLGTRIPVYSLETVGDSGSDWIATPYEK